MKKLFPILLLALCLTACAPAAKATPVLTTASVAKAKSVLTTAAGAFEISSARWVSEVHGVKPGPGEKLLLVYLTGPGGAPLEPGKFPLEAFDKAIHDLSKGEVHLSGSGGAYAISTMAGWVGEKNDQFAMGFRLPAASETYQLFWPGNEPIAITPIE
jgi:hypothetical protein